MLARRRMLGIGLAVAAAAASAQGCFLWAARPGESGLMRKVVTGKEAPHSLLAVDYTRCLVSERVYEETRVGTHATCYWISDRGDRTSATGSSAGAPGSGTSVATGDVQPAKPELAKAPTGKRPKLRLPWP